MGPLYGFFSQEQEPAKNGWTAAMFFSGDPRAGTFYKVPPSEIIQNTYTPGCGATGSPLRPQLKKFQTGP